MKRIPITAARHIAKEYVYEQVVIYARRTGDGGGEHIDNLRHQQATSRHRGAHGPDSQTVHGLEGMKDRRFKIHYARDRVDVGICGLDGALTYTPEAHDVPDLHVPLSGDASHVGAGLSRRITEPRTVAGRHRPNYCGRTNGRQGGRYWPRSGWPLRPTARHPGSNPRNFYRTTGLGWTHTASRGRQRGVG
jgi:hypothetical protein